MMMLVMMMPNVNVWGTQEEYIARKHVFVFKVSLFYFLLFFFIFSKTSTRENDF